MSIFKGAGVAIVTPMKENEEVNYEKLQELIDWQIDQGTDAIIIAGTTGESSTLTMEEHSKVIKAAVEFAKHRVPVVAGSRFELHKRSNLSDTGSRGSRSGRNPCSDTLL